MVTPFDPSQHKWTGVIPFGRPRRSPRVAGVPSHRPPATSNLPSPIGWFDRIVPTINQHGDSCVGQGWANWFEAMLRNDLGRAALKLGEQIDGYAIWKRGREMFNNGDLNGGLYLPQGYAAMIDLGMIPTDSELIDVNAEAEGDLFKICSRLKKTPLVQGNMVHKGWFNPNPRNGCIDHRPDANEDPEGGHCTLRVGFLVQDETPFWAFQNSWGEWGWHGIGTMTVEEDLEGWLFDGPYTIELPPDWIQHGGWRKFVTKEAQ